MTPGRPGHERTDDVGQGDVRADVDAGQADSLLVAADGDDGPPGVVRLRKKLMSR